MPSQAEQIVKIQVDRAATRLDLFLAGTIPHLSRSQIQKLIHTGRVLLAGRPVNRPGAGVQPGDWITVHLPLPPSPTVQPEAAPLEIVFEDDSLVVINKPAGMVVHPAHGHVTGTLVNALLAHYPDLSALAPAETETADRPGIVHRLDRDTSGLIIVARTPAAWQHLQRQFKARQVEKTYLALVFGRPGSPAGLIDVPLGRDPRQRQKFTPRAEGKAARTHYRLREDFGLYSLLEVGLETGRTHQIRVHLAWLGHPVVGDSVYGRKKNPLGLNRQFLHAWRLRFTHPQTGEPVALEAPLDQELQTILNRLRDQLC
ncbi:MAG: RluA family pseudouridine synthase [Chloroflexota bacterium]